MLDAQVNLAPYLLLCIHALLILQSIIYRVWQERLYETLFPSFYALGHISCLVQALIPEPQRTLRALSDWIYDSLYSLEPYRREDKFLTDVVQTTMLAFALDRTKAIHHTRQADCVALSRPPRLLRKGGYVVHDLLIFLEASSEFSVAHGVLFIK